MANTSIMQITPEIAKRFLELNVGNRPVNKKHVARLVSEMSTGQWKFNGDSIKIGQSVLIDGQHRLHAVVISGVTITSIVVTDLDESVFDTIDCGVKRRPSDVLSVAGFKNTPTLGAAARICIIHDGGLHVQSTISNQAILEFVENNLDLEHYIINNGSICFKSVISAIHYLTSRLDPEKSIEFSEKLTGGNGIDKGSPILAVRNFFINQKQAKRSFLWFEQFNAIAFAWFKFRAGQEIHSFRMPVTWPKSSVKRVDHD